jgi:tetratricopeptide repeat protein
MCATGCPRGTSRGPRVGDTRLNLSITRLHLDDLDASRTEVESAASIFTWAYDADHPQLARALDQLGTVLRHQADFEAARRICESALGMCRRVFPPMHPDTARVLANLGSVVRCQGDYAGARGKRLEALEIQLVVCFKLTVSAHVCWSAETFGGWLVLRMRIVPPGNTRSVPAHVIRISRPVRDLDDLPGAREDAFGNDDAADGVAGTRLGRRNDLGRPMLRADEMAMNRDTSPTSQIPKLFGTRLCDSLRERRVRGGHVFVSTEPQARSSGTGGGADTQERLRSSPHE